MDWDKCSVLITGGNGFIGANLIHRLINMDVPMIRVIDNMERDKHYNLNNINEKVEFIQGDLRDKTVCLEACKDIDIVYSASDIIVSSSAFGEGFSNALAEGMSSSLIPIATNVGDSKFIVGKTGKIVKPRNMNELYFAMKELLESGIGYGYHVIHKMRGQVLSKKMDAAAMRAAAKVGTCIVHYGGKSGKGKRIDMEMSSPYYKFKLNIRDTQGKDGYPTRMMCDFTTLKV